MGCVTVNAVRDIGAGLKTLVGGELTRYNEMMNDARALATKRMVAEAEAMGADAVVAIQQGNCYDIGREDHCTVRKNDNNCILGGECDYGMLDGCIRKAYNRTGTG